MLHIILLILKAIGILLLSILGLILCMSCLILFVPIRYQIAASKYEEILGTAKISWLLHILHIKISYEKEKVSYRVYLFRYPLLDSRRPPKEKKKRSYKKKRRQKKKSASRVSRSSTGSQGKKNETQLVKSERVVELHANEEKESEKQMEPVSTSKAPLSNDQEVIREGVVTPPRIKAKRSLWQRVKDWICEKCSGIKRAVTVFWNKLKHIWDRIRNFIPNLKRKIASLTEKKEEITRKIENVKNFWQDADNKSAIKRIWKSIKQLLRHVRPRKIKGYIHYGTGDPCSTGQILGGLSVLYPLYGKHIRVTPDFLEEVIEGELYLAGRIRVITLLAISVRLLLNKEFKQLRKRFQTLKEEL